MNNFGRHVYVAMGSKHEALALIKARRREATALAWKIL